MARAKLIGNTEQLAFIAPRPDQVVILPEDMRGIRVPAIPLEEVVLNNTPQITAPSHGLEREVGGNQPPVVNNAPGYAVTTETLNSFSVVNRGDPYFAAKHLYYGVMDFLRIGKENARKLFQSMNSVDIAAFLVGYSIIKHLGGAYVRRRIITHKKSQNAPVRFAIPKFVQVGYHNCPAVRGMIGKGFDRLPKNANSLVYRVDGLPDSFKQAFKNNLGSEMEELSRSEFTQLDKGVVNGEIASRYIRSVSALMRSLYAGNQ